VGLYLWFFSDTVGDANLLRVNEGFTGGVFHAALVVSFVIGLLAIFSLDEGILGDRSAPAGSALGFGIPILVAIAVSSRRGKARPPAGSAHASSATMAKRIHPGDAVTKKKKGGVVISAQCP
jgi:hypothetical protein